MDASRQLVRLGDFARKDGIPFARDLLRKARGAIDGMASTFLGREIEERLDQVKMHLAPHGVDPFGWDPDYARYVIAGAAALSRSYFRTIVSGVEKIPSGRVILVANHSGQIPLDGVMIAISVFLEANPPRIVRAMVEKWSQTLPFVSTFFAKCGQVVGVQENAALILKRGEPLLVFPEGTRGLSKTFQHRYELTDFGLGFMRLALSTDTPILPVAVVGAEEQYISVANMKSVAKALHMPSFPIIPQLFLPGGQLPLPTRYRVYFGDPLYFRGDPDDDDAVIEEKVWVVKATVQSMLNRGLMERKSLFF
ncbi:MAG: lysophospholipid acyltransferase family protein [Polyangiaceae bacterium]